MSIRSTGLADGIAQQLTCSVCLEEFKNPKLLRCYHSFCETCVKGLVEESGSFMVKCPQCRTEMEIPDGDVKSLKCNFFLNNILELMEKSRKRKKMEKDKTLTANTFIPECRCDKEPVVKCKSCKVLLCESCIDAHLENPDTKDHEFINAKQDLCDEHLFEEKKFFCQKCEDMVCEKCLRVYHLGHLSFDIQRVFSTQKKMVDWFLVKCKSKIPVFKSEIERFKVMEEMTDRHAEETKQSVDEYFESLISALREKNQELKDDIDNLKGEKLKQIYYEKENLTMILESLASGIEFTEQATKAGNEKEFLSMRKQIHSRMEELSMVEVPKPVNDGRWNIFLEPPYNPNLPPNCSPLVNGFAIRKGAVKSHLTMVGGEQAIMYTTFAKQKRKFTLTLQDEHGENRTSAIPNIRVAIRLPSNIPNDENSSNFQAIPIDDNNDGTYSFSYEPRETGIYYISISINGRPLEDDLKWTVEAPLGFGDRSNKEGAIQLYPPVGAAPAWSHLCGTNFSWTIRRVYYESYSVVRAGAMMDLTPNKWGWVNGKREEPGDVASFDDPAMSSISAWKEGEELSFFNNEETGTFIIYNNSTGVSEVFERCPGTAVRPYIFPTSYDIFCMDSSKPDDSPLKLPVQQHSINNEPSNEETADADQETANRTTDQEKADGTSNQEKDDGTSNQEKADGTSNQEKADGTSNQEKDDGTSNQEKADGTSNQEKDNGMFNQEKSDQEKSDGTFNQEKSDGTFNQEKADETSQEEITK